MRVTGLCMVLFCVCAACGACEISYGELPLTAEAGMTDAQVIWQTDEADDAAESAAVAAETVEAAEAESSDLENTPPEAADPVIAPETDTADPVSEAPPPDNASSVIGAAPEPWPDDLRDPYPASYTVSYAPGYPPAAGDPALPNDKRGWYYNRNTEHQPPTAQQDFDIRVYDAHYLGDITQKRVYLTFDEGYENGFTAPILDILKEKNVPAAFFLTKTYIRDNPALSVRIAAEGHVAANHSVRHISFPDLTDAEITEELTETARYFEEITGYVMPPFVRPPSGEYSVRSLAVTQAAGYKTIFWSFAHEDWLVDKQPGKDVTFARVMDNLHNGTILLLHAVSESNTEALPAIIDAIREQGYTFGTLYELPNMP